MGYGDEIMATGLAKGLSAQGRRAAFGDGRTIQWSAQSAQIFENNPNVAAPGEEGSRDLLWIPHYKGNRMYNRAGGRGWLWNRDFRPTPGEFFFTDRERARGRECGERFVVIEPNVPSEKAVGVNKRWDWQRFQAVVNHLRRQGVRVLQFDRFGYGTLKNVDRNYTHRFRDAAAVLERASLFIGTEGGLHHAAAAVKIPAVVLFGGFIPVSVTGYDTHVNLGDGVGCGSLVLCEHCRAAMDAISAETVIQAAEGLLNGRPALEVSHSLGPIAQSGLAAGSRDRHLRWTDPPVPAAG